jgi:hypothetical protein
MRLISWTLRSGSEHYIHQTSHLVAKNWNLEKLKSSTKQRKQDEINIFVMLYSFFQVRRSCDVWYIQRANLI